MMKKIYVNSKIINYKLERKNVKNLNLRIKSDGIIYISANRHISETAVEEFISSKSKFIFSALESFNNKITVELVKIYEEKEVKALILELCQNVYPYFEKKGIKYPEIKFRKMISQWGNCRCKSGILTFNTNLMYAPFECIEYVVYHEFTHFLVPNHSEKFYKELSVVCPDWKERRNILKSINIHSLGD